MFSREAELSGEYAGRNLTRRRRPRRLCASDDSQCQDGSCGEVTKSVAKLERGTAKEATAWQRMEERGAAAEKARNSGRRRRSIEEVKRSAAQSLKDVQAKTKVALEKAALAAQEREEETVARTDAKARREERTLRVDSEQAIVACSTARLKLEVDQLGALHRRSERARRQGGKLQERFDAELRNYGKRSSPSITINRNWGFERLQKQHQTALALADERLRRWVATHQGKREDRRSGGLRRVLRRAFP